MAEFCTCGSIMIDGSCTNRNCANKAVAKASSKKSTSTRKKTASADALEKKPRARKASKCITYNLYDIQSEENVN